MHDIPTWQHVADMHFERWWEHFIWMAKFQQYRGVHSPYLINKTPTHTVFNILNCVRKLAWRFLDSISLFSIFLKMERIHYGVQIDCSDCHVSQPIRFDTTGSWLPPSTLTKIHRHEMWISINFPFLRLWLVWLPDKIGSWWLSLGHLSKHWFNWTPPPRASK